MSQAELRIREAARMGFTTCIIPKGNADKLKLKSDIRIIGVSSLEDVLNLL